MRTIIAPSFLTGLIVLASLSAACSSSDDGGGSDVPTFLGPLTPAPGAPGGVPGAPPAAPGDPLAPGGVVTPGTEGQPGAAPLVPGAPVPDGSGAPAPGAPTDGTQPPPVVPGAPPAPASFFTSGVWSGPVTTEAVVTGTTISPANFDARVEGQPFCAAGSIAADPPDANGQNGYQGVGRLKFTLSQAAGGAPQAVVPQANGLAFTFTRTTGHLLRIQLQPPAGANAAAPDGWCYAIPEVKGQAFAPYDQFSVACHDRAAPGAFYAGEPIEAISFNSPGAADVAIGYDFCVAGIADANDVSGAPPVPPGFLDGDISGTLGETFQRAMVTDAQGRKLIVQNNGWGDIVANSQQLTYTNNSFTVTRAPQGNVSNEPLTFPSLYIGQSGFIDGSNALATRPFDNLPIPIANIQSIPTRFAHNVTNADANATYDVWFAPTAPTAEYQTATGAFLMVWTYTPGNRQAIGNQVDTVDIEGVSWQVWSGLRGAGEGATGADANAPVISYVKVGDAIPDYSFDLKVFIDEAVSNNRMSGNLLLTDVFAGFEIWSGGQGLSVTNFEVEVIGN